MAAKPTQTSDDVSLEVPDEGPPVHFATRLALAERARAAAFAELGSPVAAMVRNLAVSILRLLRPRSLARAREEGEASDDTQGPNSGTRLK
jgi:hypothetical protein